MDYLSLEALLEYTFKDKTLLQSAFTHSSFANECKNNHLSNLKEPNNERLEFLGDAVLDLVVSDILMELFPKYHEGQLSQLRSSIVNEDSLAKVARDLNLGTYLKLGKGEHASGGGNKDSILASTLEAIVAAIYLDGGYLPSFTVTKKILMPFISQMAESPLVLDFKSKLQEYIQYNYKQVPKYRVKEERGPDHDKTYGVNVLLNNEVLSYGEGKSKKEAEQNAAKSAYHEIIQQNPHQV